MKNHMTVNNEAEHVEPNNEADNAQIEENNEENELLIEPVDK